MWHEFLPAIFDGYNGVDPGALYDVKVRSNRLFLALDLYWRSLESGGMWYTSKRLRKTIWVGPEIFDGYNGGDPGTLYDVKVAEGTP